MDNSLIEYQEPPQMGYGKYLSFKGYNLFGVGHQLVHDAGSSMISDTPTFKKRVVDFLQQHFEFDSEDFRSLIKNGKEKFFDQQKELLERFESDKQFRINILDDICSKTFDFNNKIKCNYFEIAPMLFFIKEYNYLRSSKRQHKYTKDKMLMFYSDSDKLLNEVYDKIIYEDNVGYLLDICYGRYYFLELNFKYRTDETKQIRHTPMAIINEFWEIGLMKTGIDILDGDEKEDAIIQKKIIESEGYSVQSEIDAANNRIPELKKNSSHRYTTNARLAKTVIKNSGYICEIDSNHKSFLNKNGNQYMEAHHLVPMSSQKEFLPINIDREENIVSICPTCHKAIHYGNQEEKKIRLFKLYEKNMQN